METIASLNAIKDSKHHFKKSLGQNFLKNDEIVKDIVSSINKDVDAIVEIGPGIGALTQELLTLDIPVLCVELDDNLIDKLNQRFSDNQNFNLIHMDCLDLNTELLDKYFANKQNIYLVANIPYYITSPIIDLFINKLNTVKGAYLMVQKEVANRVCANDHSKAYGSLSVFCQTFCECNIEFYVDKSNFVPQPKVDSAIISLIKTNKYDNIDKSSYQAFVQSCFVQKRKTLLNNLSHSYSKWDKEAIKMFIKHFNFKDTIRSEEISVDNFVLMYENYRKENYE